MFYTVEKDTIHILENNDFNIAHILECGQIFNYEKVGNSYIVYSKDKKATVNQTKNGYDIICSDAQYFVDFFDLNTDYTKIKQELYGKYEFLDKAINFGSGIRILNQDPFEMTVSFIISANNNIPRIQKAIKYLCKHFGEDKGSYFAFPTLNSLLKATEENFKNAGLGYRAPQMIKALNQIKSFNFEALKHMQTQDAINSLINLSGVGLKVADCIMLFGLGNKEVFPVDTWIEQVYNEYFTEERCTNRKIIRENLTKQFGTLSGYAQQYLFYFQRSGR